jgi:hypothetical protein
MQVSKGINKDTAHGDLTNVTVLYANTTANGYTTGATDGLFLVTGAELVGNGNVSSVTITTQGAGYTARPFVDFTGSYKTRATGTANLTIVGAVVTSNGAGTNYTVGDRIYANGSANGTSAVLTVAAVGDVTTGNVTLLTISTAGDFPGTIPGPLTYFTGSANTVTRANATGFKANLTYGIGSINITGAGEAYNKTDAAVSFTANGATTAAVGTIVLTGDFNNTVHGFGTGAGWNLRKSFTGGRAGRVQYETLVALGNPTNETGTTDDSVLPE